MGGDMSERSTVTHYSWDEMEKETVSDTIKRRIVTGERAMLAHIYLDKGARVPKHSHHNEQITYLLEGVLKFWIGEEREEIVLKAGEVLHIPPNVPHEAEALEDCLDVDVFSPPREDWLNGTDHYLRGK
jgi:quercetin dioxygenase-like cupin family protein